MAQPQLSSLGQLFVHELQDALSAEQQAVTALQHLSQCGSNAQLQQVFSTHLAETQNQIDRLTQVFQSIGVQPQSKLCEGMQGIVQEHQTFVQQMQPAPQVHAVFDVDSGQKVEQYEITTYQHLVDLAEALGYQQAAQVLEETLQEEQQQLERLQQVEESLDLSQLAGQEQRAGT